MFVVVLVVCLAAYQKLLRLAARKLYQPVRRERKDVEGRGGNTTKVGQTEKFLCKVYEVDLNLALGVLWAGESNEAQTVALVAKLFVITGQQ